MILFLFQALAPFTFLFDLPLFEKTPLRRFFCSIEFFVLCVMVICLLLIVNREASLTITSKASTCRRYLLQSFTLSGKYGPLPQFHGFLFSRLFPLTPSIPFWYLDRSLFSFSAELEVLGPPEDRQKLCSWTLPVSIFFIPFPLFSLAFPLTLVKGNLSVLATCYPSY